MLNFAPQFSIKNKIMGLLKRNPFGHILLIKAQCIFLILIFVLGNVTLEKLSILKNKKLKNEHTRKSGKFNLDF